MTATPHESKARLLNATIQVVRRKGYTATRVEDVCEEAGLTKGSFFHHFKSKDELALAALERWRQGTTAYFAGAQYHEPKDALGRLLAYVDLRQSMLTGKLADFTCFPGTVVQETWATHPALRTACEASIVGHARTLETDIRAAIRESKVSGVSPASLALHMQAVVQGAFIVAKCMNDAAAAEQSLDHLRRYLTLLFKVDRRTKGGLR
jgi:TetR/AcrR family transcriptional regulator, transcriptional repressor for nem operon